MQYSLSRHNVFNMTIVQVLTQQVEQEDLESQIKEKEQLMKKVDVDLCQTPPWRKHQRKGKSYGH